MMTKQRCIVTLEFDIETREWGGREWREQVAHQCRDVVRAVNAMPKLTGCLKKAALTTDTKLPTYLRTLDFGAPLADAPKTFHYCQGCPNTSYCATQGVCARVKAQASIAAMKETVRAVYGEEGKKVAREFGLRAGIDEALLDDWLIDIKRRGPKAARKKSNGV